MRNNSDINYSNNKYYYISVFVIIILSFLFYSSKYYPLLNSDDALNILMAYYYKFPNDLYCWGQDRGGTLIPLISQIFIKLFRFSALTSVSFSNYLILIIGYFGFSNLLKTNYSKLIFCIVWFLPFQRFIDILRFPLGAEYSLLAFAILLISKMGRQDSLLSLKSNIMLFAIVIIFILSIWVSDLAIVSICILLFVLYIFEVFKRGKMYFNSTIIFYFVFGLISCFLFIKLAKSFSDIKTEHYLAINSIDSIVMALNILKLKLVEVLSFRENDVLISVYTYSVLIFLIVFSIFIIKVKSFLVLISNKWISFFLLDFIVIFITFLLSSWVLGNGMGRWYYVASYISLSLAIVLSVENLSNYYYIKYFKIGLLFIVLLGAISPIYSMKYVSPKSLRPMVSVVGEFKELGKIGIISEYWNSYITSCPDPSSIKATPNDQSSVRNQKLVDMVFENKNIYIIKDMWLNEFPDTLSQFGYVLVKRGNQFRLGGCDVCKYEKIKIQKYFQLAKFKYNKSQVIFDNLIKRNVLRVSSNNDTCTEKYFIYGPYIPLGIGAFTARFYVRSCNFKSDNSLAVFDVSTDWGKKQLSSMKISRSDFHEMNYNYIDLNFVTTKRYTNIEFRIFYYGYADLYFDHLELNEK